MKLFTVQEANDLLAVIRPKLEKLKAQYVRTTRLRKSAKFAAQAGNDSGGGGMESGTHYVKSLYEIGKITTELHELGVQLKDYSRGLIDFPSLRDNRTVLLCWQLGEVEQIEWWHEIEAGFAGRKPL